MTDSLLLLRGRLVTIARRELDDRTLTPGEAQQLLDILDHFDGCPIAQQDAPGPSWREADRG